MAHTVRTLSLPRAATGLAVRPRPSGGSSSPESPGSGGDPDLQALVFTEEGGIHELLGCGSGGSTAGDLRLGPPLAEPGASGGGGGGGGYAHGGRCPAYDPATQAVWFLAGPGAGRIHAFPHHLMGTSSAGHGAHSTSGSPSSTGAPAAAGAAAAGAVRLSLVSALAADGHGGLWVLDWGRIRRLDTRSGGGKGVVMAAEAAGFEGAVPAAESGPWWHLACCGGAAGDAAEAVALLAATGTALCRVRTGPEGGGGSGGVELLAGSWSEAGCVDGAGAAARFSQITALLPLPGTGRLLVADGPDLRCVDVAATAAGGGAVVSTLVRGCFAEGGVRQLAVLPGGREVAALLGGPGRHGSRRLVLIDAAVLAPKDAAGPPRL